jgi:hypothetical protein
MIGIASSAAIHREKLPYLGKFRRYTNHSDKVERLCDSEKKKLGKYLPTGDKQNSAMCRSPQYRLQFQRPVSKHFLRK